MVAAGRVSGRPAIRPDGGLIYPQIGGRYNAPSVASELVSAQQVQPPSGSGAPEPAIVAFLSNLLDALTREDRRRPQRDIVDAGGARWSTPTITTDGPNRPGSVVGTVYETSREDPETVRDLGPQRVNVWQDDASGRMGSFAGEGLDYGPPPYRVQRPWYTGMRATGGANSRGTTDTFFTRLRLRPMLLAANVGPGMATRRRSVAFQSPSSGAQARIPAVRVPVSSISEAR